MKKRDGTHRFCVDYRQLSLVTKPDRFPLPRIEDLLDLLGQSAYFSTLDLASGFWQIRLHPNWDRFLPGVLFAYRNTPHSLTGEKPSFLLYGVDCRSPTEAAYLPTSDLSPYDLRDYREELMLSLTSARELAADTIQRAQARYKHQYDKGSKEISFRVGDWILVRFPQDESGRWQKLSRPWHGPYRIVAKSDPGVTYSKVYYPQYEPIRVHQSRICLCPQFFRAGFFWYGGRRRGPGRPPRWVEQLLRSGTQQGPDEPSNGDHQVHEAPMQTHPQTADSDLLQPQGVPAA